MIFLISFILICIYIFLLRYLFSKSLIIQILLFPPGFQAFTTFLRFILSPLPFSDPTYNYNIDYSDALYNINIFLLFFLLVAFPLFKFLLLKFPRTLRMNFQDLKDLVDSNINFFSFTLYIFTFWNFVQTPALQATYLDDLTSILVRFFGASWFFAPLLPFKRLVLPTILLFLSLPFAFAVGNRSGFIYPISLVFLGFLFKTIYESSFRGFFKLKRLIPIGVSLLVFLAFVYLSILFRINREADVNSLLALSQLLTDQYDDSLYYITKTLDRLVQWQFHSALIVDPQIGFDNIVNEFFFVFSNLRYNFSYMQDNIISLGLLFVAGLNPSYAYTTPLTYLTEGAIRFGHFGAFFYVFLSSLLSLFLVFTGKAFSIPRKYLIVFVFTISLFLFNSESLFYLIKTLFQFVGFILIASFLRPLLRALLRPYFNP